MPVGVEAFVDWVSIDEWPNPTCPKCLHGLLVGKEGLSKVESGQSERWRGDENWDPDWIYGALAGVLTCNNSECGETVAVAGSWRVGYSRSPYEQYAEQLFVRYFDPPLHMMKVPTALQRPLGGQSRTPRGYSSSTRAPQQTASGRESNP